MLSLCLVFSLGLVFWRWERKLRSFTENVAVALLFNLIFTCKHSPAVALFIQKVFLVFLFRQFTYSFGIHSACFY